jgi:hypothetical protein
MGVASTPEHKTRSAEGERSLSWQMMFALIHHWESGPPLHSQVSPEGTEQPPKSLDRLLKVRSLTPLQTDRFMLTTLLPAASEHAIKYSHFNTAPSARVRSGGLIGFGKVIRIALREEGRVLKGSVRNRPSGSRATRKRVSPSLDPFGRVTLETSPHVLISRPQVRTTLSTCVPLL